MNSGVSQEMHAWRALAQDLGIEVQAPFSLEHVGARYTYVARLPQFGSAGGMLVMYAFDPQAAAAATENGYGYSCVELGAEIDRQGTIEMLRDWGWSKSGEVPPEWCREA
jgi:hypothetical protein